MNGARFRRTIVIADDDEDIREMLRLALEPLGQEIVAAADGESAWREVLARWPAILVTDEAMAGVSGLELCRRLRECAVDVRVVIYTAGMATEAEALAAGADALFSKGVPVARLRELLEALCKESDSETESEAQPPGMESSRRA